MKKVIREEKTDWLYMNLHMFEKGILDGSEIRDDLIKDVKNNGVVLLNFTEEEYIDLLDLNEEDKDTLKYIFNRYYGYGRDYKDFYSSMDDWREGYILILASSSNVELFEKIKSLVLPQVDFESNQLWDFLEDNFAREVRNIVDSYNMNENTAIEEAIKIAAKDELCEIYMPFGIYTVNCFTRYNTTVKKLISLYEKYNCKSLDLKGLLTKIMEDINLQGGFSEWWEFEYREHFDEAEFNLDLKKELENIIEKIEESDIFVDLEKYREIVSSLKFQFSEWYPIPKNKLEKFQIRGVDPQTNKIIFIHNDKYGRSQQRKLDYQDFMNFLHHPELF